jgi:hypothetical protein
VTGGKPLPASGDKQPGAQTLAQPSPDKPSVEKKGFDSSPFDGLAQRLAEQEATQKPSDVQRHIIRFDYPSFELERAAQGSELARQFLRRITHQRMTIDAFLDGAPSLEKALDKLFLKFGEDEEEDAALLKVARLYLQERIARREAEWMLEGGRGLGKGLSRRDRASQTDTDDPCAQIYDAISDEYEICVQLREYGVSIWQEEGRRLDIDQLTILLSSVQLTGTSLQSLLRDCGVTDSIDVGTVYSPQNLFNSIFGPVEFGYNTDAGSAETTTYRNPDNEDEVLLSRIVLAPDTFAGTSPRDAQRIIIHELGHVFQNILGQAPMGTDVTFVIHPEGAREEGFEIRVTSGFLVSGDDVPGGEAIVGGTALILEDYLNFTEQYWAGSDIDFGYWTTERQYTANDLYTEVYTNRVYQEVVGGRLPDCEPCNNVYEFLIDRNNQCMLDDNGNCRQYTPGERPSDAVYIRRPGTFIHSGYYDETNLNLFLNERRENHRHPSEGFADTFSAAIRLEANQLEGSFSEDEPRRQFFEENRCCWFEQLLDIDLSGCQ